MLLMKIFAYIGALTLFLGLCAVLGWLSWKLDICPWQREQAKKPSEPEVPRATIVAEGANGPSAYQESDT